MAKADPFRQVIDQAVEMGKDTKSAAGKRWLQRQIKKLVKTPQQILRLRKRMASSVQPGQMYLFRYNPQGKKTLSYYDIYPLVFPLKASKGGFIGLNLHYLSPKLRGIFLAKLLRKVSNHKFDETTRLRISYNMLKGSATYKEFKPCIKLYLMGQVQSRFLKIDSSEWEMAAVLPLDAFQKKSSGTVWSRSVSIIQGD